MFYSKNTFTIVNTRDTILAIPPANGLTAYTTDTNEMLVGNGTSWGEVLASVGPIITPDIVRLNKSNTTPGTKGDLLWNSEDGTLDIKMGYDDVTQEVGLEQYMVVRNTNGTTMLNGKAVMFSGVLNERPTVQYAIADGTIPSIYTIGVLTMDIPAGETGYATTYGYVHDLDTSAWNVGDILYISTSALGGLTNVKPVVPNITVPIAAVIKKDATTGIILVRPTITLPLYYGAFSDSSVQNSTHDDPKAITFNTTDTSRGVRLGTPTSRIYCDYTGQYNFQFSIELRSSTSSARSVWIWPRVDGHDIPNSATELIIKSNSEVIVPSWNFQLPMLAGQYFELIWTASGTELTIESSPEQTSPFAMPAIPGIIMTVNQINQ